MIKYNEKKDISKLKWRISANYDRISSEILYYTPHELYQIYNVQFCRRIQLIQFDPQEDGNNNRILITS